MRTVRDWTLALLFTAAVLSWGTLFYGLSHRNMVLPSPIPPTWTATHTFSITTNKQPFVSTQAFHAYASIIGGRYITNDFIVRSETFIPHIDSLPSVDNPVIRRSTIVTEPFAFWPNGRTNTDLIVAIGTGEKDEISLVWLVTKTPQFSKSPTVEVFHPTAWADLAWCESWTDQEVRGWLNQIRDDLVSESEAQEIINGYAYGTTPYSVLDYEWWRIGRYMDVLACWNDAEDNKTRTHVAQYYDATRYINLPIPPPKFGP